MSFARHAKTTRQHIWYAQRLVRVYLVPHADEKLWFDVVFRATQLSKARWQFLKSNYFSAHIFLQEGRDTVELVRAFDKRLYEEEVDWIKPLTEVELQV